MQLFKECAEIHPAVSKAGLFTQIVAVGRIHAILGVEIADIGSENIGVRLQDWLCRKG